MISNKKMTKIGLVFTITLAIFLIMQTTFASEDIIVNQSQELSVDNNQETIEINRDANLLNEKPTTVYADASAGSSEGKGTADDPIKSISDALRIINNEGTIYLTGNFKGEENSNIILSNYTTRLSFIGVGQAIIDGDNTNTFATVNSGTYSFSNISFVNHFKSESEEVFGGVFTNIDGTITFKNCLFENNSICAINKANGGAIDNTGRVTITNCTFKNNVANVTNSSGFRKNAADGGALSNLGKMYIYDSIFIENKALRNGGAIRTQDSSYTYIENCDFTGNVAAGHLSGGSYGGAIYTWDCSLDLYNSTFKNNRIYDASGYGARGGALSLNRGTGKINIFSCEFINNTADGITTVDGQSLYFESVKATANYCTIDTSIYSISQSVDLNYNFWITNSTGINELIENLPSSAAIKTYAELKISTDAESIEIGKDINIYIDLYWNNTKNQNNISSIPVKVLQLDAVGGILKNNVGELENGSFKTTLTPKSEDVQIIVYLDNVAFKSDLSQENSSKIIINTSEISEGEEAVISITLNDSEIDFCLIELNNMTLYGKLNEDTTNISIFGLKAGKYDAKIKFYNNRFEEIDEKSKTLTVNGKQNTSIEINSAKLIASDTKAGEKGGYLTCTLKDIDGNVLENKSIQIAFNGKIYTSITDNHGIAKLQVILAASNTYNYAVLFDGDEKYNPAPLKTSQLTITKKTTSIKASSKTFNVKTKTKIISVTLKTSKNKYDGKTYLYKGKKVTLKINGKIYSGKTNNKNLVKFKIKLNKKGKYIATVKFSGDSTYKASIKKIKVNIK
ncbi:right-handed parallel beta-helix repeat-containing protein [uncultured Methanobrevibacter sp.]|uniref:right-handed parallel beta-helix repeat-containing protein n=1 Tax=uncultured Methanobrevibacter sp. TaxID=253161 RepID=UPI0025DABB0A|nr:right-handed parallel beta-helix repeat-containing protein [uncultured Methanobrevibacter sp.]